jgi:rare lipoprotein A
MGGRRTAGKAVVAALLACTAVGAASQATAGDIEAMRVRAQGVADEITGLEHRLASLRDEQAELTASIERAGQEMAVLEVEIHEADAAYRRTVDRFVERAVESYKAGSTGRLSLLLSAENLTDMYTILEASSQAAELDSDALEELLDAKRRAERAQADLDRRKQRLLTAQTRIDAVHDDMAVTLAQRRATFDELNDRIKELERQQLERLREQAGELVPGVPAAWATHAADRLEGTGPANGVPKEFISTGVTFEGEASWYGPGFEGNRTANGDVFDSSLYTAASKELPLGSYLYIEHEGRGVVVYVNDRGPYAGDRVLDLSRASAQAIGITGVGWVGAEVILKKH